jgi:hypothetical protein
MQEQQNGGLGDDPTVALEKEISTALVDRGKEMLAKILVGLNNNGCDPVRIFRLLENIAKHHRELIAALHGGDSFRRKNSSLFNLGDSPGYDAPIFGNQEENFGAQALKGLVEGLKKPQDKGGEIKALTEALSRATSEDSHPSMNMLARKLEKRLEKLLDETVTTLGTIDLPTGGEATVECVDEKEETDAE